MTLQILSKNMYQNCEKILQTLFKVSPGENEHSILRFMGVMGPILHETLILGYRGEFRVKYLEPPL